MVPNYGFQARIADFDFTTGIHRRLHNTKVENTMSVRCARPLPDPQVFGHCRQLVMDDIPDSPWFSSATGAVDVGLGGDGWRQLPNQRPFVLRITDSMRIRDGVYAAVKIGSSPDSGGEARQQVKFGFASFSSSISHPLAIGGAVGGQVCILQQPWCAVDWLNITRVGTGPDDPVDPTITWAARLLLRPECDTTFALMTVLQLADTKRVPSMPFIVQEKLDHPDGRTLYIVESVGPPITPISSQITTHNTTQTGFVYRVAVPDHVVIPRHIKAGITSRPNDKYDLHYVFEWIKHQKAVARWPEAHDFVTYAAGQVPYGSTARNSYRMTAMPIITFCNASQHLDTNDVRIASAPTPAQALTHEFFTPLQRPVSGRARQIMADIDADTPDLELDTLATGSIFM